MIWDLVPFDNGESTDESDENSFFAFSDARMGPNYSARKELIVVSGSETTASRIHASDEFNYNSRITDLWSMTPTERIAERFFQTLTNQFLDDICVIWIFL